LEGSCAPPPETVAQLVVLPVRHWWHRSLRGRGTRALDRGTHYVLGILEWLEPLELTERLRA